MNALRPIFESLLAQRLGWTLLHSLWEGAGVMLLLAGTLPLLRRRSPQVRYLVSCMAMAALVALPVITFVLTTAPSPAVSPESTAPGQLEIARPAPAPPMATPSGTSANRPQIAANDPAQTVAPIGTFPQARQAAPAPPTEMLTRLKALGHAVLSKVQPSLPWLVLGWVAGVLALSFWNLGGWVTLHRLKSLTTRDADEPMRRTLDRLAARLRLRRPVRLLQSALTHSPMVIGVLRPVILLPASVLAELPVPQLESLLAHELAHVRRHDYLVNLLQTVVETLLFYHPAVWWISRRIRVEREHCCDDLALSVTRDRSAYVHALAAVAAMNAPSLAPAATGGALLARVRRLLGVPDADAGRSARWLAGAVALGACVVLLALARVPLRAADPPQPEKKEQAAGTKELVVKFVNDQTGEAIPGVPGSWWLDDRNGTDQKRYTSDSRGELRIPLEPGTRTVEFFYHKEKFVEGMVALGGEFGFAPLTGTYTLRMKPGVAVGGVVHDEAGAPVAGAKVSFTFSVPAPERPYGSTFAYGGAETGTDGRWTFDGAPTKPTQVEVYVKHPDFVMDSFSHRLDAGHFEPMFTKNLVLSIRRGVTVTGTVVDEQGHPIAKAEVTPKQFGLICCTTTDAQGRFRLGGVEPGQRKLAAKAPGYAPQLLDVVADKEVRPVEFRLAKGQALRGRVVDTHGQPVAGASIDVTEWRGSKALGLGIGVKTGADGKFAWNEAPADEVVLTASHREFRESAPLACKATAEATLILPGRLPMVRGTVVDDATNKAVEKFAVHIEVSYVHDPNGMTGMNMDRAGSNGKYELTVNDDKIGSTYRIRVQADGYLPAESPVSQEHDGQVEFSARMKRTGGMTGTVTGPDGKPAAAATVVLNERMAVQVEDGAVSQWSITSNPSATADAAGHFVLPARPGTVKLVIVHQTGWGAVVRDAAAIGDKISLTPWCSVEGVYAVGGKPVAGRTITLRPDDFGRPGERDPFHYRQNFRYSATTDEAGRFTIRHVIDGDSVLAEEIAVQDGKTTSIDTSHSLRLALHAGEHRAGIQIGGTGRPVTAHVAIPEDLKARGLVPTYGTLRLDPPRMPQPENWHTLTPQERFELRRLFERGVVYQDYAKRVQEIIAPITPDGALRAEDVPAGKYTLSVMALRKSPNDPTFLRPEASTECAVEVPEIPGGRSDQPLDVGVLNLQAVHYLQVGEPAPAFVATGFDNHPIPLSDYRGKYVLLDFWATWCGPCIAEMKHLEEIHSKYGNDPRFVILGISVDDRAQEPAQFLEHRKLPWPQAFGGRTGTSSAWRAFGIGAIPSIWLIGPDGKILAKELEPEKIDATIKAALSRPQ